MRSGARLQAGDVPEMGPRAEFRTRIGSKVSIRTDDRLVEGSAGPCDEGLHRLLLLDARRLPAEKARPKPLLKFLRDADLRSWNLEGANLRRVDAGNADLLGANLRRADLRQAWLGHANLREACLAGADLRGARLLDANMEWSRLPRAQLSGACLAGANLRGANLWRANLQGTDLWCARLWGANLSEACLEDANLVGADLRGADLRRARLSGAFLDRVKLGGTQLNRHCFGQGIGEELVGDYLRAREVYRALRETFESLGQYEDARWAHQKEYRVARQNHGLSSLTGTFFRTWEGDALSEVWQHFYAWARWMRKVGAAGVAWPSFAEALPFPPRRAMAMRS